MLKIFRASKNPIISNDRKKQKKQREKQNSQSMFYIERKLISFGGHPYFVVVTGGLVNNRLKTLQFVPLRAVGPQNRHNFGD